MFMGNLMKRNYSGDQGIKRRIILKWALGTRQWDANWIKMAQDRAQWRLCGSDIL
jgi:hypothetical protein